MRLVKRVRRVNTHVRGRVCLVEVELLPVELSLKHTLSLSTTLSLSLHYALALSLSTTLSLKLLPVLIQPDNTTRYVSSPFLLRYICVLKVELKLERPSLESLYCAQSFSLTHSHTLFPSLSLPLSPFCVCACVCVCVCVCQVPPCSPSSHFLQRSCLHTRHRSCGIFFCIYIIYM